MISKNSVSRCDLWMDSVPPKTVSRFGKQCCGQEGPWGKGCTRLPHSLGSSYPRQRGINFPNMSGIHLSACLTPTLPGETIPGQLCAPPPAGSRELAANMPLAWSPRTSPAHSSAQHPPQPRALSPINLYLTAPRGTWLQSLWHAGPAKAWSALQVRRGHVKTSMLFREARSGTGG